MLLLRAIKPSAALSSGLVEWTFGVTGTERPAEICELECSLAIMRVLWDAVSLHNDIERVLETCIECAAFSSFSFFSFTSFFADTKAAMSNIHKTDDFHHAAVRI